MRAVAVCVSVVVVVAALVHGQEKRDPVLDRLASEFAAAFNAKDAAKIAAFYADDAVVMPPNQPLIKGRRSIEAYYQRGFAQDFTNLRLTPMELAVAGARAFEVGTSSLLLRSGSSGTVPGSGPVSEHGKYVVVYKQVSGDWKIAYDIFNSDESPSPPAK